MASPHFWSESVFLRHLMEVQVHIKLLCIIICISDPGQIYQSIYHAISIRAEIWMTVMTVSLDPE